MATFITPYADDIAFRNAIYTTCLRHYAIVYAGLPPEGYAITGQYGCAI